MSDSGRPVFVVDTGPLSHFARIGRVDVLRALLAHAQTVVPDVVARELRNGMARHPSLRQVVDADWIADLVTLDLASTVVDELLASDYRLPSPPGGFAIWATDHDLL